MRNASPVVLAAFAHPDDEAFGVGGTLAWLADRGAEVHVLLGTSGDAGQIFDPALDTAENRVDLAALREREARAAAEVLGAHEVHFLRHSDGTLERIEKGVLMRELTAALRELRPDVVLTFGPEGIYGHPDHVAMHVATVEAVRVAADPALEMGGGEPHSVGRVFYQVLPADTAEEINDTRGPVDLDGREYRFIGYSRAQITTTVDVSDYAERKLAALKAYRSQTAQMTEDLEARFGQTPLREHFMLGAPDALDVPGLATDPMAGLL